MEITIDKPRKGCLKHLQLKTSTLDIISCFLGEFVGTAMLLFLGCMGCMRTQYFANTDLQGGLNFGFVVLMIIQCFGCVSGAHLNPSVTIAAYVYKLISLPIAGVYIVAQFLGAFVGYGLLKVALPPDGLTIEGKEHRLCVTVPNPRLSLIQAIGIEFAITAALILVCCGAWDPRNAKYQDSIGVRFGVVVASISITAGPLTGASMNPARSFAPALWNNDLDDHWIFWVAPLSAAVVTSLLYKAILRREVHEEKPISKFGTTNEDR